MVDEYDVALDVTDTGSSSDSSMVDEYGANRRPRGGYFYVQIPLWSMNTQVPSCGFNTSAGSDSSMVDEYLLPFG